MMLPCRPGPPVPQARDKKAPNLQACGAVIALRRSTSPLPSVAGVGEHGLSA